MSRQVRSTHRLDGIAQLGCESFARLQARCTQRTQRIAVRMRGLQFESVVQSGVKAHVSAEHAREPAGRNSCREYGANVLGHSGLQSHRDVSKRGRASGSTHPNLEQHCRAVARSVARGQSRECASGCNAAKPSNVHFPRCPVAACGGSRNRTWAQRSVVARSSTHQRRDSNLRRCWFCRARPWIRRDRTGRSVHGA